MPLKIDLSGMRFGKLLVIKQSETRISNRCAWECKCDCGKDSVISGVYLTTGQTKSCGCYAIEVRKKKATTHGLYGIRIYNIWSSMIQRCEDKKRQAYKRYGGVGISICVEWRTDFLNFYNWAINNGYDKTLSIDRFPNKKGNYCPQNCRWATQKQQTRNQTSNVLIEINGESNCVTEWAEKIGVSPKTIYNRIYKGWDYTKAVLTPIKNRLPNTPSN